MDKIHMYPDTRLKEPVRTWEEVRKSSREHLLRLIHDWGKK